MTIVEHMLEIVRRKERKPTRPHQRDEQIYAQVRVQGRTQAAVAAEQGLSQPRISQIVRRVEDWRRSEEFLHDEFDQQGPQRRIDRALDRQRLEEAYIRGMRAQERAERERITTERSGERGGKPWSEKSIREQGVNVQGLKTALRAMELMWKLEDRPQGTTRRRNAVEQLEDAVEQLRYVRKCALRYGGLQCTEQPEVTVARLIEELIGEKPVGAFRAEEVRPPEPTWDHGDCPYPAVDQRPTYSAYCPSSSPDEPPVEVAPAEVDPTEAAPTSCAAGPQPSPPLESWIYVPVKKPDISPPLTPAQRLARRELLPRMEWVHEGDQGMEIRRS